MVDGEGREPLLPGTGVVLAADLCRASGLERPTLEVLVRTGRVGGLLDEDGRVVGVPDDRLPTPEQLTAWGCAVLDTYAPDDLRSYADAEEPPSDADAEEPPSDADVRDTWTMSWPDDAPPAPSRT